MYFVAAISDDVDAVAERVEEERRRPGVVQDDGDVLGACAAAAMAGTSWISKVSEPGLSRNTARVLGLNRLAMPAPINGSK